MTFEKEMENWGFFIKKILISKKCIDLKSTLSCNIYLVFVFGTLRYR